MGVNYQVPFSQVSVITIQLQALASFGLTLRSTRPCVLRGIDFL